MLIGAEELSEGPKIQDDWHVLIKPRGLSLGSDMSRVVLKRFHITHKTCDEIPHSEQKLFHVVPKDVDSIIDVKVMMASCNVASSKFMIHCYLYA